jgi:large subunit ribosomal protein L29
MKTTEFVKRLRSLSSAELKQELTALRREQFNLRMAAAMGQQTKSHLVADARKKIARVKTMLQAQLNSGAV